MQHVFSWIIKFYKFSTSWLLKVCVLYYVARTTIILVEHGVKVQLL